MAVDESEYPDIGKISIAWNVSTIDGRRRLGWQFISDPVLDRQRAIALLKDVVDELQEDELHDGRGVTLAPKRRTADLLSAGRLRTGQYGAVGGPLCAT